MTESYGSSFAAACGGARDGIGAPALVIAASFLGFGSMARSADLTMAMALFSTATGWALPGQVVMVELYGIGASLLAIALGVALTNMRLLPMTLALMPHLRAPGVPKWRYYAVSHLIAVTSWFHTMRHCPALPPAERLPYLAGHGLLLWAVTLAATAIGFVLAGVVPVAVSLGLVAVNPIYFTLLLINEHAIPSRRYAVVIGAVCGPIFFLVERDWSLLLTGLLGGSLAFVLGRRAGGRHG